jgi:hypothetical protein
MLLSLVTKCAAINQTQLIKHRIAVCFATKESNVRPDGGTCVLKHVAAKKNTVS